MIQDRESHQDVALIFNVKPALIRNLVRNEKLGRNQVHQIEQKRIARKELRSKIKDQV